MVANFQRHSSAEWKGSLLNGGGTVTTQSSVLDKMQYSFRTRFAKGTGTNPEELIAAALGGSFSMALSSELGLLGLVAESIQTTAITTLENLPLGWTATGIVLDVHARIPRATQSNFIAATLAAKSNCPIARLLRATVSMTASLDN